MSSSDHTRNLATNATSKEALPTLQKTLQAALLNVRKRGHRGPEVGIVGPGGTPEGKEYPPQVQESIDTMLEHGHSGTLNVYYFDDPRKPKESSVFKTHPETGRTLKVVHHEFDLTRPDPEDTSQNDVVIATRVMNPVLGDPDKKDSPAYRKGVINALRAKGKADSEFITDARAAHNMLGKGGHELTAMGKHQNSTFSYSEHGSGSTEAVAHFGFRAFEDAPPKLPATSKAMASGVSRRGFTALDESTSAAKTPRSFGSIEAPARRGAAAAAHQQNRASSASATTRRTATAQTLASRSTTPRPGAASATRRNASPPPQASSGAAKPTRSSQLRQEHARVQIAEQKAFEKLKQGP